jgi:succinate dehydrogenase / fumarate reductase cytochrome b subunit
MIITLEWRPNNLSYPYGRNWFYTIQRITGIILFFFIAFHVLNFRFGIIPGLDTYGKAVAHHPNQAFDIVKTEFGHTWIFAIYVVGITSTVWHLANGVWLFMVDWGIAIGARAQRVMGYACIAIGAALLAVGINAAAAFLNPGGIWGGILY